MCYQVDWLKLHLYQIKAGSASKIASSEVIFFVDAIAKERIEMQENELLSEQEDQHYDRQYEIYLEERLGHYGY